MQDSINKTVELSVELALTALLLGIIALLGGMAYSSYGLELQSRSSKALMQGKVELYAFDNKVVSSSDILEVITENIRVYSFHIVKEDGSKYIVDWNLEPIGNVLPVKSYRDLEHIKNNILEINMRYSFHSKINRNADTGIIEGLTFTQGGAGS